MHRVVMQLKRRLATQGHETRGRKRHAHVDVRRTMRASLQTGGVPVELRYRPRRPRRPELYVLCDVSTSVTSASVFFLSVLHALHDSFRKMRSFVFVERISEVTDVFERERSFKAVSDAISKDAGVADVSGYTDYGRVWREFLEQVEDDLHPRATVIVLGDARTNGRDPAAHVFAQVAERAGPHVLAQPRAAAVLELRRLGDRRLRAVLRGLRVLDDAPARGLREGAHAPGARVSESTAHAGIDFARGGQAGRVLRRGGWWRSWSAVSTLPGVGEVRDRLASADPCGSRRRGLCAIGSMLGFVRALWAAFDRVILWRRTLVLGMAEQGANVLLPAGGAGGPALGAYVLQRLGVPRRRSPSSATWRCSSPPARSASPALVAGGPGRRAPACCPATRRRCGRSCRPASRRAVIALAVLYARRPPPADPHGGRVREHRSGASGASSMTARRPPCTCCATATRCFVVGAFSYFAFDVASLACAFQAFGGGAPPLGEFVVAYALGHAGALIPTPGGVGGTEGGLIGMFVVFGTPLSLAAAAVLAYRVFQLGHPGASSARPRCSASATCSPTRRRSELVAAQFTGRGD